jgi:hypothetical protein
MVGTVVLQTARCRHEQVFYSILLDTILPHYFFLNEDVVSRDEILVGTVILKTARCRNEQVFYVILLETILLPWSRFGTHFLAAKIIPPPPPSRNT